MITGKIFSIDGRNEIVDGVLTSFKEHDNDTLTRGEIRIDQFSDNEISTCFMEHVRGQKVFLVASTNTPENIIKMNLACDAARRASAQEVICVIPYFGYARQDRKDGMRGAIGARVMMNMLLANGMDRLLTIDLHADQIQGFANVPIDHISGYSIFKDVLFELGYSAELAERRLVIVSPDAGGVKRASVFQKKLLEKSDFDVEFAMLSKMRSKPNEIARMDLIGNVDGADVLIIDDMIDTAGTLCTAAEMIKNAGAASVSAMCTHGVLSGPAYERIGNSILRELYVSNSLETTSHDRIESIDISNSIAQVIYAVMKSQSYYQLNTEAVPG